MSCSSPQGRAMRPKLDNKGGKRGRKQRTRKGDVLLCRNRAGKPSKFQDVVTVVGSLLSKPRNHHLLPKVRSAMYLYACVRAYHVPTHVVRLCPALGSQLVAYSPKHRTFPARSRAFVYFSPAARRKTSRYHQRLQRQDETTSSRFPPAQKHHTTSTTTIAARCLV